MRIVNTFISDDDTPVPHYTKISLQKARELNPDIEIDFICNKKEYFFDDLNINWIPQVSLENGSILKTFNSICDFRRHGIPNTTYPSPRLFWHRTAERVFYLQEYLQQTQLQNVFHFENDVLIYYPLSYANDINTNKISITDMSPTHTTFAFCHVPRYELMTVLCLFFIKLLMFGERKLMQFGYDHISEMSLLNMALKNELVQSFPILKNDTGTFVYDPGSYGQYFGGTNNGHSNGFTDNTHHIGRAIRSGEIRPIIENGFPQTESNKIFNLHIHSKNLERFI